MTAKIDRTGLHAYLWNLRSRQNTLVITQTELAEELAVSKVTLNKILREFEYEGRVHCVTSTKGAPVRTYEIFDPQPWIEGLQ